MEVRELPRGEEAPEDSDRVTINVLPSGKAGFSGIVRQGGVTAHFLHHDDFTSESDALAGAVRWAEDRQWRRRSRTS